MKLCSLHTTGSKGNAIRDIARVKTHDGNLRPHETNFLHLLAAMSRCVTHPLRD